MQQVRRHILFILYAAFLVNIKPHLHSPIFIVVD